MGKYFGARASRNEDIGHRERCHEELCPFIRSSAQGNRGDGKIRAEREASREGTESIKEQARVEGTLVEEGRDFAARWNGCCGTAEIVAAGIREVKQHGDRLAVRVSQSKAGIDWSIYFCVDAAGQQQCRSRHAGFRNQNVVLSKSENGQPCRIAAV